MELLQINFELPLYPLSSHSFPFVIFHYYGLTVILG
nr:MAG TPA: hypothetical protein [Caudoviricetes sp.]